MLVGDKVKLKQINRGSKPEADHVSILTQAFIVKFKWFCLASSGWKDKAPAVICHFAVDHSAVGL